MSTLQAYYEELAELSAYPNNPAALNAMSAQAK